MRESGSLDQGGGCTDGEKIVLAGLGVWYLRESEQRWLSTVILDSG